uniref:Uncharacterized protein n=1 Tax=Stomoxys calcitrans TaxID=35570 RepID=A0A1I8PU86_STOCA
MSSFVDENASESKQQNPQEYTHKLDEEERKIKEKPTPPIEKKSEENDTKSEAFSSAALRKTNYGKCEQQQNIPTNKSENVCANITTNDSEKLESLLLPYETRKCQCYVDDQQQETEKGICKKNVTTDNRQQELLGDILISTTALRSNEQCDVVKPTLSKVSSNLSPLSKTDSPAIPPLSLGDSSSSSGPQIPLFAKEQKLAVQLREKQQEHSTKQTTGDHTVPYYSRVIKSGTASATTSPNMVRKMSDGSVSLPRRVSFPKSDNELVTGYLEPANPWKHVCMVKSISEIAELYMTSCLKHNTKPLQYILDHLKAVDITKQLRQPVLSLKSIDLAPSDCEALEEVLKRVQYKSIDVSDCKLNEVAASALFEIIEYYEATNELDISSNSSGMTPRGWMSCTYMISHSQELQVLNAEGNPISKVSAEHLGVALNTSNLHTLKLEHCSLKGLPLSGLCFKLWHNKTLKELWIAYNDLDSSDADTIAEMLKVNHYLELIDISNNNIGDEGLRHIVMSLIMQSKELERRTTFQRAAAIDDDESMSPFETTAPVDISDCNEEIGEWGVKDSQSKFKNENEADNETKCKQPLSPIEEKCKSVGSAVTLSDITVKIEPEPRSGGSSFKPPLISTVGSTIEEIDPDEDTDDTVRSNTLKGTLQTSGGGQSMLDKLLSMNSESSSEEGVSNLSTDTLAACCSEDTSLISDDVFDIGANATASTTITTSTTFVKCPTDTDSEVSEGATETPILLSNIAVAPTSVPRVSHEPSAREMELESADKRVLTQIEAKNSILIEPPADSSTCHATTNLQSSVPSSLVNNYANNNNINNNTDNNNVNMTLVPVHTSSALFSSDVRDEPSRPDTASVFEVKAEESHCRQSVVGTSELGDPRETADHPNELQHLHSASKALDVNKNTRLGEDFDDTHSTDSAFESASEGDISRHQPEEFTRLSASLESTRLDDLVKEFCIETATIASESNECLIAATNQATPSSTPTPQKLPFTQVSTTFAERERPTTDVGNAPSLSTSLPSATSTIPPTIQVGFGVQQGGNDSPIEPANDTREKMPKVTIAQDSIAQKYKINSVISTSPSQTPPPPSTSPGGVSSGLRRTDSSCTFLTQSTRHRSQSTDSLCSDNSLDGSIGSGDLNFSSSAQLNEKLTKNDTLTRQQRQLESTIEASSRAPGGLKALALWNNNLSKEAGLFISNLLAETVSLELLNIGKNCLTNDFVSSIKDSLIKNTTLTTLGLQSAQLSAKGIETLTSIMTFGGNSTLQRIDIRGNKVEVESLTKIAEVLKSNTTVTQIDIDDEPNRMSVSSEAHLDYARVLENVRSMCARNEKTQQQEKASINPLAKRRGGYYVGSRKISLTCHSRPVVDTSNPVMMSCSPTSNSKLEVKRKAGTRLRSPVPSPTTISPSSSPNRGSRFQVYRVAEVSPLISPNVQKEGGGLGTVKAISSSSVFIPSVSTDEVNDSSYSGVTSTSLPTSCSLPSMATISSSTQSIKRLSVSPRSRFLVRKVYEDPSVPLSSRTIPPITPPINPPPTPMLRDAKEATHQIKEAISAPALQGDDLQHTVARHSNAVAPTPITSTCRTVIQQHTTTDSYVMPILKVREVPRATQQSEQSTNDTAPTTKNETTTTQEHTISATTSNSALQPSPSILSTLSTFSSSSSASDTSSSSSILSSSSSSSSTSPASNIDSSDSSSSTSTHSKDSLCSHVDTHDLTVSGQCPIAVFGDNDITLTKNTANEAFVSAAVAVARENVNSAVPTDENSVPPVTHQQRVRKVSWIANPTAVDKLLTLFHNPFQRSSSPESKGFTGISVTTTAPPSHFSQMPLEQSTAEHHLQSASQKNAMPIRKQSPPTWTKIGTDMLTAAGTNNVDLANSVATTAAAVVTEQMPLEQSTAEHHLQSASQKNAMPIRKQSPPTWTKIGTDMLTAAGTNNVDLANSVATTAAAVVTEQ